MHRLGTDAVKNVPTSNIQTITEPKELSELFVYNSASINDYNYMRIASEYNVVIDAPPAPTLSIGKAYKGTGTQGSSSSDFNDLKIPEGYTLAEVSYKYSHCHGANRNLSANLIIGSTFSRLIWGSNQGHGMANLVTGSHNVRWLADKFIDTVPVSVIGWDIGTFSLNVTALVERTPKAYQDWQTKAYDAIVKGYETKLQEYYDWLNRDIAEENESFGTNPLFYREIEQITLKRNCLAYLLNDDEMGQSYYTGNSFTNYAVTRNQDMDNYASLAKFMEQAFEWNLMSYSFYPYYWGKQSDWVQLYRSETDDPIFRDFMQAGMARVIVSVRPGFEDAVMHYMNFGEIWNGGAMPVIGDPLYMSIVDELKEQEYVVEETWETVVPTSLIGLQEEGVSVRGGGLPCGDGCEEDTPTQFIENRNKITPELPPVQSN
ncbi:hypothetical protein [Flavobacterium cyanobacteriorum]|nr:hypothetical protein [Flavobacterium cyanobacteriorum]